MKTKSELIIEALKTGRDLSLSEIAAHISESTGQAVKLTDISSVLSKLSKPEKADTGFFIQRRKKPKRPYRYKLVDEALEMTTGELIDLSHKTGKDRFTLEQAGEKYPGIKKYVKRNVVKKPEAPKAKTAMPERSESAQHETPVANEPVAFEQQLIEKIKAVLAQGLTINVNVNLRS